MTAIPQQFCVAMHNILRAPVCLWRAPFQKKRTPSAEVVFNKKMFNAFFSATKYEDDGVYDGDVTPSRKASAASMSSMFGQRPYVVNPEHNTEDDETKSNNNKMKWTKAIARGDYEQDDTDTPPRRNSILLSIDIPEEAEQSKHELKDLSAALRRSLTKLSIEKKAEEGETDGESNQKGQEEEDAAMVSVRNSYTLGNSVVFELDYPNPLGFRCLLPHIRPLQLWGLFVSLCLLYMILAWPVFLCFVSGQPQWWILVVDVFLELCFMVNIVVVLLTAFIKPNNEIERRFPQVAQNWIIGRDPNLLYTSRGVWQIVALLPIDFIVAAAGMDMYVYCLCRMVRVGRVEHYINSSMEHWRPVKGVVIRIMKAVMFLGITAHFCGCLWYGIARAEGFSSDSWVGRYDSSLSNAATAKKYLVCLYWSITTMTTVGYGDITPITTLEIAFAIVTMLLASSTYAYLLGNIASYMEQKNSQSFMFSQRMSTLGSYMKQQKVKGDLQEKVKAHHVFVYSRGDPTTRDVLFRDLPVDVRTKISKPSVLRAISRVKILKMPDESSDVRDRLYQTVVGVLKPLLVFPGDSIVKVGEEAHDMYFIEKGKVAVSIGGNVVTELKGGDYFGEIALLFKGEPRTATVVAVTHCILHRLRASDFHKVIHEFPKVKTNLRSVAEQRLVELAEGKDQVTSNRLRRRMSEVFDDSHRQTEGKENMIQKLQDCVRAQNDILSTILKNQENDRAVIETLAQALLNQQTSLEKAEKASSLFMRAMSGQKGSSGSSAKAKNRRTSVMIEKNEKKQKPNGSPNILTATGRHRGDSDPLSEGSNNGGDEDDLGAVGFMSSAQIDTEKRTKTSSRLSESMPPKPNRCAVNSSVQSEETEVFSVQSEGSRMLDQPRRSVSFSLALDHGKKEDNEESAHADKRTSSTSISSIKDNVLSKLGTWKSNQEESVMPAMEGKMGHRLAGLTEISASLATPSQPSKRRLVSVASAASDLVDFEESMDY